MSFRALAVLGVAAAACAVGAFAHQVMGRDRDRVRVRVRVRDRVRARDSVRVRVRDRVSPLARFLHLHYPSPSTLTPSSLSALLPPVSHLADACLCRPSTLESYSSNPAVTLTLAPPRAPHTVALSRAFILINP